MIAFDDLLAKQSEWLVDAKLRGVKLPWTWFREDLNPEILATYGLKPVHGLERRNVPVSQLFSPSGGAITMGSGPHTATAFLGALEKVLGDIENYCRSPESNTSPPGRILNVAVSYVVPIDSRNSFIYQVSPANDSENNIVYALMACEEPSTDENEEKVSREDIIVKTAFAFGYGFDSDDMERLWVKEVTPGLVPLDRSCCEMVVDFG